MSTPISQIPADVLEKIEKLMNLAARGGTEAEAQAAFAKASQLMTKYGIEQHHLQESKAQKTKPGIAQVDLKVPVYASERPYHLYVRQIIRHCFNVCIVRVSYRHRSPDYYMLGSPDDCAFAGYVFDFLSKTFLRLVNKHLKENNLPRSPKYFNGYWDGLRIGFCNAWDKAQREEIKQQDAQSYALVLVDKEKALTQYLAQQKDIKTTSTERRTDGFSMHAGIRDGAQIKIHRALGAGDNKAAIA